jgi:hypothetical protein
MESSTSIVKLKIVSSYLLLLVDNIEFSYAVLVVAASTKKLQEVTTTTITTTIKDAAISFHSVMQAGYIPRATYSESFNKPRSVPRTFD